MAVEGFKAVKVFLSTFPVWGATIAAIWNNVHLDISIHVPRVGSDPVGSFIESTADISIHVPRVGSDLLAF